MAAVGLGCLLSPSPAAATVSLTLIPITLTFPDSNPIVTPSIAALENPVQVSVTSTTASGTWSLTVMASSNFLSGSDSIPISNVTWTASGVDFLTGGTMSSSASQAVATGGKGTFNGALTFHLANRWTYATGQYHTSIVYVLVGP